MARKESTVKITYRHPGTQPPIFLAGSFSDPPWLPQEMDCKTDDDGEHTFTKDVHTEPGSHIQYKFRVGEGDWWVLDESAPTVTDDAGNRNNVLEAPPAEEHSSTPTEAQEDQPKSKLLQSVQKVDGSGTSTPVFARTAAEVADSAALLDKEDPEPQVPDEIAGEIGLRRMSLTPIPEVAKTASEVADTARDLDQEEPRPLEETDHNDLDDSDPLSAHKKGIPPFSHEAAGLAEKRNPHRSPDLDLDSSPLHEQPVPLFEHECTGRAQSSVDRYDPPPVQFSPDPEYDLSKVDLKDPNLKWFPTDREEIFRMIDRLSATAVEEEVTVDGGHPSPIYDPTRYGTAHKQGERPTGPPGVPGPLKRLEIPEGKLGSEQSSPLLGSIAEAKGEGDVEEAAEAHVGKKPEAPVAEKKRAKPPEIQPPAGGGSGSLSPIAAVSPASPVVEAITEPLPDRSSPIPESLTVERSHEDEQTVTIVPDMGINQSPTIVVHAAEPIVQETDEEANEEEQSATDEPSKGTALESSRSGQLRKRNLPAERSDTPTSVRSAGHDAVKRGNWLQAFIRLIFVDWIGGFIRRLIGEGPPR